MYALKHGKLRLWVQLLKKCNSIEVILDFLKSDFRLINLVGLSLIDLIDLFLLEFHYFSQLKEKKGEKIVYSVGRGKNP